MKDGFIFHFENIEDIEDMSLEEQGLMFRAMIEFAQTGKEPEFDDKAMRASWKPIRRRMVKDNEAYEDRCRRNRENGQLGGRPRKQDEDSDSFDDQNNSAEEKQTVNDDVEENHMDNVSEENNHTVNSDIDENRTVFEETQKTEWFLEKPKKPDTDTDTDTDTETDIERDKRAPAREAIPYRDIIEYLNQKAGTSYRPDAKESMRHIKARWKEGYRIDDFKSVIDKKAAEWKSDAKMAIFLRPITLFSTKFESYLNQPKAKPKRNAFCNYEQRDDDLDELERKLNMQFVEMMMQREDTGGTNADTG